MQLFRVELPARAFPAAASRVTSGVHIYCGERSERSVGDSHNCLIDIAFGA
jgi:hypothetical protein